MKALITRTAVVLAIGLSLVSTAFASDTGTITISRIAPWSAGTQIQIPMQVTCGSTTNNQLVIPNGGPDTTNGRNFQIALAAFLAGKSVNINWSCNSSTATVSSVRLLP
jgi:hypothetical protein